MMGGEVGCRGKINSFDRDDRDIINENSCWDSNE